jgi:hypothetical protein
LANGKTTGCSAKMVEEVESLDKMVNAVFLYSNVPKRIPRILLIEVWWSDENFWRRLVRARYIYFAERYYLVIQYEEAVWHVLVRD